MTGRAALIDWGKNESLRALFGNMPPLDAEPARALGFRVDADLGALAKAALSGGERGGSSIVRRHRKRS